MAIRTVEVQEWTTEEIYEMAGKLIAAELNMSIGDFVKGFLAKKFDTCDYMEIVGLLSLLPEDDENYIGSQRAA